MSTDRLVGKQRLYVGDKLTSLNGRYVLVVQRDGNVVIYDTDDSNKKAIWSTKTGGRTPAEYWLCTQSDQNIVLYKDGQPSPQNAMWSSKSSKTNVKNIVLSLQNDGNLVGFGDGKQFWASQTSEMQRMEKKLQAQKSEMDRLEKQLQAQKQTMQKTAERDANMMRKMYQQTDHHRALASSALFAQHCMHHRNY